MRSVCEGAYGEGVREVRGVESIWSASKQTGVASETPFPHGRVTHAGPQPNTTTPTTTTDLKRAEARPLEDHARELLRPARPHQIDDVRVAQRGCQEDLLSEVFHASLSNHLGRLDGHSLAQVVTLEHLAKAARADPCPLVHEV